MDETITNKYFPTVEDIKKEALEFCLNPQNKDEILNFLGIEVTAYTFRKYVTQLVANRYISPVNLRNLKDPNQKYQITNKGKVYLKSIEF